MLTLDGLARAAGTTGRNVRALQDLGLLRRPRLAGRTGTYDGGDLQRLRAVLRLQARGYSQAAIRDLLEAWESGATLADVLGLPPRRRRPARGSREWDWSHAFDALGPRAAKAGLAAVPGYLLPSDG